METQPFKSIWDAIEDTAELAPHMRLRSELMIALRVEVEAWRTTQARVAKRLGITQPRLNDPLRGWMDKFSLDALVAFAERAGFEVRLRLRTAA
jgi:predicted XRE-type DNA-binding protein